MRHQVAANSTTARRRGEQRRKGATPEPAVVCPICGRTAMAYNARERAHVCLFLGCRGRVAAE